MQYTEQSELVDTINKHRQYPHISIDEHAKSKSVELSASIDGVTKVYLDKRFWILLRDAHLGRSKQSSSEYLLCALRESVKRGAVICPISESIFLELLKQQDLYTRRATAELIDELSLGLTVVPFDQRVAQEIVGFMTKSTCEPKMNHETKELVWSKLSYVLGVVHPTSTPFTADVELALQKAFFDHMWDVPLVEMLEHLEECDILKGHSFQNIADNINDLNRQHSDEVKNFKKVYTNEFRGGLSLFMSIPRLWIESEYQKSTGRSHVATEAEKLEHERKLHTFFGNLITEKRVALSLPTLHINSLCHAAVRWDKGRKLSKNDFYDFHHAAAAVGYCDAFMTEKPLMALLKQRHLELENDFPCKVMANVNEAVQWMEEIIVG